LVTNFYSKPFLPVDPPKTLIYCTTNEAFEDCKLRLNPAKHIATSRELFEKYYPPDRTFSSPNYVRKRTPFDYPEKDPRRLLWNDPETLDRDIEESKARTKFIIPKMIDKDSIISQLFG